MKTARTRIINSAWAELHHLDPKSTISQSDVRGSVIGGYAQSRKHWNRYLVGFDALLRFLVSGTE